MCMFTCLNARPWASTASIVSIKFCPSPVQFSVSLLLSGGPTAVDFSRFIFHVPISGSTPCPNAGSVKPAAITTPRHTCFMVFPPGSRLLPVVHPKVTVRLTVYVDTLFDDRISLAGNNLHLAKFHRFAVSEADSVYAVADSSVGGRIESRTPFPH